MLHGQVPYGYRPVRSDGKDTLEARESEAETVRLIYEWYVAGDGENTGLSINAIRRKLSEMGVPRPSGRAKGWARSTVYEILSGETYAGLWYYGKYANRDGKRVTNPHSYWLSVEVPAIVTRETWEAAQRKKEYNRENAPRNNKKFKYLLSKRVTCGHCGRKMGGTGSYHKGRKKPYVFYRCPVTHKPSDTADRTCNNSTYFPSPRVDAAVWEWVKSFLTEPEAIARGLDAYQSEREREDEPIQARLAVVESLIAERRKQLEKLLDLYLSGDFPREMLTRRKAPLETTIQTLTKERAGLTVTLEAQTLTTDQILGIQEFAANVAVGLEQADFVARRQIIESLDVRATLMLEQGERVIYSQCVLGQEQLDFAFGTS